MTYTSAARLLLSRFETYLAGVFHPVPQERVVTGAIQSFYGWFFPFLFATHSFAVSCNILPTQAAA